jgi:hypothetical protein
MTAPSNILRLAIFGLLLSRAPRWLRAVLGWMLLGAFLTIAVIVFAVSARAGEEQPRYWPSYQAERFVIVPPPRPTTTCPQDGPGAFSCGDRRDQRDRRK